MSYTPKNLNGQATMANSEPVVIASDQSAVPVSGTVTANLSATDNAVLDAIEVDTSVLAGAVTANKVQTEVTNTITVGSHAVTNAGTFAVQVTSAPTTTVTATDLDIRNLTNTDVVTAELSAVDNAVLDAIAASVASSDTSLNDIEAALETAGGLVVNLGVNNDVTVTGTVAVTQSGTWDEVGINDSGNSITIDAPVGTPAFVRLSDGASAITTLPVSLASVPSHAVTNAGTFAVQSTNQANSGVDIGDVTINNAAGASAVNIQDGGNTITVDGTVAVSGTTTTKELRATTGTNTSVADSATSVTILASNANRLGATVSNDSSAVLYLLLGSTAASTTNYSARIVQYGYYEVPYGYTGQLTGIWASDPGDGAARVTEIT